MKRSIVAAALAAAFIAPTAAVAAPNQTVSDATPASWTGPVGNGLNTSWFLDGTATTGTCANTSEQTKCDSTLVFVDSLATFRKATVRMDGFTAASDFDLRVYLSNAAGAPVTYAGSPVGDVAAGSPLGTLDPRHTGPGDFETKELTGVKAGTYYLVQAVYFAVANDKPALKFTLKK